MRVAELFLFGVIGWCAIGAGGVVFSLARRRRTEALKHVASIATVAGVYLLILLAVAAAQREKVIPLGKDQCFQDMCFAVVGVDEVPGLVTGDDDRVIRVAIRVTNRGSTAEADESITAYLVDSRGRAWEPLPGLSGNRLASRVAGGSQMLSQPMFRVAKNSAGLGLVFTHGNWQLRRLVMGDSDSLGHRPTMVGLGR